MKQGDGVKPTRIVDVVQTAIVQPDDIVLVLEGGDGRSYPIQIQRDVALKLIEALRLTAAQLPEAPTARESSIVYRVVACHQMLTTDPQMGLVLTTEEGLEIALRLDQQALDQLIAGIRGGRTSSTSPS